MHPIHILIYLFGITLIAASSNKNYFTSPVSNTGARPVFTLGDQLLVSWVTELGEFNVTFWQQSLVQETAASQGNIYSKVHASDQVTNFTWTVQLLGFDLSYSNEFFFWVNPDGPDGFVSTYFNITEPTTTTTTAATAATATATSMNTLNLATPVSSNSPSASHTVSSPSASPASATGLTTTGKIALGVGIGIGLPLLCALIALIWLISRCLSQSSNNKIIVNGKEISAPTAGTTAPFSMAQERPSPPYTTRNVDPKELQHQRFSSNHRFELADLPYR